MLTKVYGIQGNFFTVLSTWLEICTWNQLFFLTRQNVRARLRGFAWSRAPPDQYRARNLSRLVEKTSIHLFYMAPDQKILKITNSIEIRSCLCNEPSAVPTWCTNICTNCKASMDWEKLKYIHQIILYCHWHVLINDCWCNFPFPLKISSFSQVSLFDVAVSNNI